MSEPSELFSTKSDFAYIKLREKILSGEYEPGAVLNQSVLARTIGISTTPLREALRRLKSEGLVELDAHRDARVTQLTAEQARDLLEIRTSLDPLAVSLAAERRSTADIREIRDAIRGLEPLPHNPAFVDLVAHRRFHTAIYTASHNEILTSTLDALWDKADRYRRLGLEVVRSQEERDQKAAEHQALLDCVVNRDAAGAAEVMRRHIDTSLGAKAASRLSAQELVTVTPQPIS
ncbi:GntR family transcriptional regulator [Actinoplanes sp. ATCC 53533]|uniref:GntR family transcriptional regulator n=1 Tax=Actinoplanes sp. ATCC 53533 TaxID=1288362 RepID=UPI000F790EDA|nr:GntR family transcriptional regulator [Actinoplanes sp. ATCC 53533]RSM68251.1 GntR family transcriptional regulator [Actinoplanes sp. ATCC 53533]